MCISQKNLLWYLQNCSCSQFTAVTSLWVDVGPGAITRGRCHTPSVRNLQRNSAESICMYSLGSSLLCSHTLIERPLEQHRSEEVHLLTLGTVYMFSYFTWVFPLSETQFWLHFRDKYCRVLPRQWGISVCNTFIWTVWILFFLPFSVSWVKLSFLPPRSLLYLRRYNHKTTIKTSGTLFLCV